MCPGWAMDKSLQRPGAQGGGAAGSPGTSTPTPPGTDLQSRLLKGSSAGRELLQPEGCQDRTFGPTGPIQALLDKCCVSEPAVSTGGREGHGCGD